MGRWSGLTTLALHQMGAPPSRETLTHETQLMVLGTRPSSALVVASRRRHEDEMSLQWLCGLWSRRPALLSHPSILDELFLRRTTIVIYYFTLRMITAKINYFHLQRKIEWSYDRKNIYIILLDIYNSGYTKSQYLCCSVGDKKMKF